MSAPNAATTAPAPAAVQRSRSAGARGLLLALEGGEGAGKSTQVRILARWLRDRGHDVVTTFEPGDGVLGAAIRSMVLDPANTGLSNRAEALLYAADRAQHVSTIIEPALAAARVVITDRYLDSSLAYQGAGRQQPLAEIAHLSHWATGGLLPDLTVLLDAPVELALARVRGRAAVDRLEAESQDFHERVRRSFLSLASADPARYLVLDATTAPETLAARIAARVDTLLTPTPAGSAGKQ